MNSWTKKKISLNFFAEGTGADEDEVEEIVDDEVDDASHDSTGFLCGGVDNTVAVTSVMDAEGDKGRDSTGSAGSSTGGGGGYFDVPDKSSFNVEWLPELL